MPPKFIRPCIPTTAKAIPRGDNWLHEPKLDGYRFQVLKDGRQVRRYSRDGYDWTKRLALLGEALAGLRCKSAVIDGELVIPARDGRPDFRHLQVAMASERQHELVVFVFDLMHYDGKDIRPMPLLERRLKLTELVLRSDVHCLHLVQTFEDGAPRSGRMARAGGHRFEAHGVALSLGAIPRLGEDEDGGVASGQPGAVAAFRKALGICAPAGPHQVHEDDGREQTQADKVTRVSGAFKL